MDVAGRHLPPCPCEALTLPEASDSAAARICSCCCCHCTGLGGCGMRCCDIRCCVAASGLLPAIACCADTCQAKQRRTANKDAGTRVETNLRGELLVVDGRLELLLVVLRRQQCLFDTQVHATTSQ